MRILGRVALPAALLAVLLPAAPAGADSLAQARAEVAAASARVTALQPRVDRALAAYERTLGDLAAGVTRSITAEQAADAAAQAALRSRRQAAERVRALYMTGGAAALVVSVLDAPSASDALRRVAYVRRLVQQGNASASDGADEAQRLRALAARLEAEADGRTVRAADVQQRWAELATALEEATAEVEALSARAKGIEEARTLLAQVAALDAAVAATGEARVAAARPTPVPPLFRSLYRQAARTCPGMSWTLLAAIGQVESGHGSNTATSYAGAQGPMQFMPATFAAYGVDGDRDGDVEITDPADAVFSAASYLCANGAGRGRLEGAIWNYNHADWYVRLVLRLSALYAGGDGG